MRPRLFLARSNVWDYLFLCPSPYHWHCWSALIHGSPPDANSVCSGPGHSMRWTPSDCSTWSCLWDRLGFQDHDGPIRIVVANALWRHHLIREVQEGVLRNVRWRWCPLTPWPVCRNLCRIANRNRLAGNQYWGHRRLSPWCPLRNWPL